ncbi:MAG: hypothetical protein GTN93_06845, partial [Anaerolineae bacterium]|nr:hypothetical protein [Anaerolineae bacterium]
MSDDSIFRKPDGDSWRDIPEDKMFQPGKVFFPKKVDIGFTLVEFEGEAGSLVCPMIRYTDENGKEATIG